MIYLVIESFCLFVPLHDLKNQMYTTRGRLSQCSPISATVPFKPFPIWSLTEYLLLTTFTLPASASVSTAFPLHMAKPGEYVGAFGVGRWWWRRRSRDYPVHRSSISRQLLKAENTIAVHHCIKRTALPLHLCRVPIMIITTSPSPVEDATTKDGCNNHLRVKYYSYIGPRRAPIDNQWRLGGVADKRTSGMNEPPDEESGLDMLQGRHLMRQSTSSAMPMISWSFHRV